MSPVAPSGLLGMGLVWGTLLAFSVAAGRLPCTAAAAAVAALAGLLTLSGAEAALSRRRAFVGQYLIAGGLLHRLLSGQVLVLLREALKAVPLGLVLLVAALALERLQWALLLADVLLLALLVEGLIRSLAGEVRADWLGPLARDWAVRVNALLLWLAWAALMYHSPIENYTGMHWEEVVAFSAAQPQAACDVLALLGRIGAVATALGLWSAQHVLGGLREPAQVLTAWAVFLSAFGASFLVALAYSRALAGVLARPWAADARGPAP